jgi:hypothetical protein
MWFCMAEGAFLHWVEDNKLLPVSSVMCYVFSHLALLRIPPHQQGELEMIKPPAETSPVKLTRSLRG